MRNAALICALVVAGAGASQVPASAVGIETQSAAVQAESAPGKAIYAAKCGACHSLDANRVGPAHRGVFGQKSASVDGYRYTSALMELDVVWSDDTLDQWLANPTAMAPGTSMGFRLSDPQERQAVISYLRSASGDADPSHP